MSVLVQGSYYVEDDIYALRGENVLASKPVPNGDGSLGLHGGCYSEFFMVPSYKYLVSAEGLDDLASASVLSDAGLTPLELLRKLLKLRVDSLNPVITLL